MVEVIFNVAILETCYSEIYQLVVGNDHAIEGTTEKTIK